MKASILEKAVLVEIWHKFRAILGDTENSRLDHLVVLPGKITWITVWARLQVLCRDAHHLLCCHIFVCKAQYTPFTLSIFLLLGTYSSRKLDAERKFSQMRALQRLIAAAWGISGVIQTPASFRSTVLCLPGIFLLSWYVPLFVYQMIQITLPWCYMN